MTGARQASDGEDLGVDWQKLNCMVQPAITGVRVITQQPPTPKPPKKITIELTQEQLQSIKEQLESE